MLLGLADDLAEHVCSRGLQPKTEKTQSAGSRLRSLPTQVARTSKVTQDLLPEGPLAGEGRQQGLDAAVLNSACTDSASHTAALTWPDHHPFLP